MGQSPDKEDASSRLVGYEEEEGPVGDEIDRIRTGRLDADDVTSGPGGFGALLVNGHVGLVHRLRYDEAL